VINKDISEIKCIIFDCDGVLVDSEEIGNTILISMLNEFELKMTLEEAFNNFSGRSLQDCKLQIEKRINRKLPPDFENEFRNQCREAFRTQLKPVKGVKKFIDKLTISYCVASSGPVDKIKSNLKITGLFEKFKNNIFSSYQINSWKPDPEIFLYASREMGFLPKECIVIEDSIAGVISAVKGGFDVYGFANENNSGALQNEGATVFYSFDELENMLNL
jgi:HAD superfamily hydrolase (TIGR01509 family)